MKFNEPEFFDVPSDWGRDESCTCLWCKDDMYAINGIFIDEKEMQIFCCTSCCKEWLDEQTFIENEYQELIVNGG